MVLNLADEAAADELTTLSALLERARSQWKATTGISVAYMARRHAFVAVRPGTPLDQVAATLADASRGGVRVRRVPVLAADDDGRVLNVISQSTILATLAARAPDDVRALLAATPLAGLYSAPAITVTSATSVADAFSAIADRGVSGVGVVSAEDGKLLGNLSSRDFAAFVRAVRLRHLSMRVDHFLADVLASSIDIRAPAISVPATETLAGALGKFVATRVHRLYVVDAGFKCVGVLSLSDVLKTFAQ